MKNNKKIVILGVGYVGLPTAIMLARASYKVIGVDLKKEIVKALNEGILESLSIKEKELEKIFKEKNVRENLKGSNTPVPADVFIICVPTPLHKRRKHADLSYVISAIKSILPHVKKGNLIIIESTIPPLTTREVIKPLIEEKTNLKVGEDIYLAHCPERLLPGNAFKEIVNNTRIIGGINKTSALMAKNIYESFVKGEIYITDDVTAEMVKLMENTYRDVNIALANEFSLIADKIGVDIKKCISLANKHPRVNILNPGIGVGGHCIPVDPWFLFEVDPEDALLIETARRINDKMPFEVATKIRRVLKNVKNPKIIALGITYKPNVSDTRESPALKIIEILKNEGYDIKAYDPLVKGYEYSNIVDICKNVDCLLILVGHDKIKRDLGKNLKKILSVMKSNIILTF